MDNALVPGNVTLVFVSVEKAGLSDEQFADAVAILADGSVEEGATHVSGAFDLPEYGETLASALCDLYTAGIHQARVGLDVAEWREAHQSLTNPTII